MSLSLKFLSSYMKILLRKYQPSNWESKNYDDNCLQGIYAEKNIKFVFMYLLGIYLPKPITYMIFFTIRKRQKVYLFRFFSAYKSIAGEKIWPQFNLENVRHFSEIPCVNARKNDKILRFLTSGSIFKTGLWSIKKL